MSNTLAVARSSSDLAGAAELILDARIDPRVAVSLDAQVFSTDFDGPLSVTARDLSASGICVASESPLSFRSIRRVRIDLPDGRIDLEAEGRWQNRSSIDRGVLTGAWFPGVSDGARSRLWDAVQASRSVLGRFISGSDDLKDLSPDEAGTLAESSRYCVIPARKPIYQDGRDQDADDSLFVVVQGEVRLTANLGRSRGVTVERLKPGRLFGGVPIISDLPNLDSAVADTDSLLLEISRGSFSYLRVAKPLLAQRLSQIITRVQLGRTLRMVELADRLARE